VIAEAIATFQYNNRARARLGLDELDAMVGTRAIFYKVPVTSALNRAVITAQYPPEITHVNKCVVVPASRRLSEGMEVPEFRKLALQHYEAFKIVAKHYGGISLSHSRSYVINLKRYTVMWFLLQHNILVIQTDSIMDKEAVDAIKSDVKQALINFGVDHSEDTINSLFSENDEEKMAKRLGVGIRYIKEISLADGKVKVTIFPLIEGLQVMVEQK
jgi:hypothetical protein